MPTRCNRSTSSSWVATWCLAMIERIASWRLRFDIRQLLPYPGRRCAAEHVAGSQGALQREVVDDVGAEERRKLPQLVQAEGFQASMGGDRRGHHAADEV